MIVDTGSSWLWAYADDCDPNTDTCPQKNIFHTGGSTTFRKTDETRKIKYGSMAIEGPVALDQVSVHGSDLVVKDFKFIAI
jgi:hypothetical protein